MRLAIKTTQPEGETGNKPLKAPVVLKNGISFAAGHNSGYFRLNSLRFFLLYFHFLNISCENTLHGLRPPLRGQVPSFRQRKYSFFLRTPYAVSGLFPVSPSGLLVSLINASLFNLSSIIKILKIFSKSIFNLH